MMYAWYRQGHYAVLTHALYYYDIQGMLYCLQILVIGGEKRQSPVAGVFFGSRVCSSLVYIRVDERIVDQSEVLLGFLEE